jgi:hypothetical protein
VTQADLVQIAQAARSLGVPADLLETKAELGAVPEAIRSDTSWMIPAKALAHIAEREGWTLDLTGAEPRAVAGNDRATTESLAAQTAVMLAKTQASAARVESQDLLRRLRVAQQTAEADRAEATLARDELAAAEKELAQLQRAKAVAEAKAEELRRFLEREQAQFRFMSERVAALEQERDQLLASLGWIGRRRYRQIVESTWDASHDPESRSSDRLRELATSQLHRVRANEADHHGGYRPPDAEFGQAAERRPDSMPPPPPPPPPRRVDDRRPDNLETRDAGWDEFYQVDNSHPGHRRYAEPGDPPSSSLQLDPFS